MSGGLVNAALMADPEVGLPILAAKHAGEIMMGVAIFFAIIFMLLGVILLSAGKTKSGMLFTVLGLFMCGGTFFFYKEKKKTS